MAYIEGSRAPQECVYVEAHYDHWGRAGGHVQPGANDNASGVAVMLEVARAVASLKPDRTVVFLAADKIKAGLRSCPRQISPAFTLKTQTPS